MASLGETFVTKSYDKKGKPMYGKKPMNAAMKAKMKDMKDMKVKKADKSKKPMKRGK